MSKQLFWLIIILLCIYILPNVIDYVMITNSGIDISETPLVNITEE